MHTFDDAWGNVTGRTFSGTTATLSYDTLNHFTEWKASATNQEWYLYDAAGQRVLRRSTTGSGTTLIVYPFGAQEDWYSSSGTNSQNVYYYSLAGHLIGSLDNSGTRYYLTDALGSILSNITNVAGGLRSRVSNSSVPMVIRATIRRISIHPKASRGSTRMRRGWTTMGRGTMIRWRASSSRRTLRRATSQG